MPSLSGYAGVLVNMVMPSVFECASVLPTSVASFPRDHASSPFGLPIRMDRRILFIKVSWYQFLIFTCLVKGQVIISSTFDVK